MRIAIVYPHTNLGTNAPPGDALAVLIWEIGRRLGLTEEVTVFGNRLRGQTGKESLEGIELRRLAVWPDQLLGQLHRLDGILFKDPKRPFRSSRLYYPFFGKRAALAVHRLHFDIIHVHAVPNFIPSLRASAPHAKIVFHAHDHRLAHYEVSRTRKLLDSANSILACSRFVAEAIAGLFPALAERCRHVYNGVDHRFFEAVHTKVKSGGRILYVGRLSPEKGVHILLQAFGVIAARHPEATLEIVGPDDVAPLEFVDPFKDDSKFDALRPFYSKPASYHQYLQKQIPSHLAKRVHFRGPLPNASLPDVYRQADLFVFPSIWDEPFGMPVVEAMASGLPVIATHVGAFPETIHDGKSGLLVERGNADALARALERLLGNPQLRRDMGTAGRSRALIEFNWDHIAERLREHYRTLN
jgi:glycosyltransferase involved in cell wall biosynthesis